MAQEKSIPVSFRFTPKTKALLEAAARHQKRSLTNTIEVLVETYCNANNLSSEDLLTSSEFKKRENRK